MPEDNYPQPPQNPMPSTSSSQQPANAPTPGITPLNATGQAKLVFPYPDHAARLQDYDYFERLFVGKHFEAFNIKIGDEQYNKAYAKLRYVMANFAGLISKIGADMLFSEPVTPKVPDGDQKFMDALWAANKMDIQCYEAALSDSYLGDALFKLRVGPRRKGGESTVIIEDITPKIYFPKIDGFNVRAEPEVEELAWTFRIEADVYLRKEIHTSGQIENQVFKMEADRIGDQMPLGILGDIPGLVDVQKVEIKESLLNFTPNWKTGNRYFGFSDYLDLDSIFYAINNRMTKVDNILDLHGDPILAVPPGILNEKGQVKKKALGVIELGEGETGKPEYIVWDAKLESAFTEIEKLVDFMYLTGEISPDILGIGEGKSDSGRALKFKLMRTIAKVARKKLYFDATLKQVLYKAQLLAKAYNLSVDGVKLQGEPVMPELKWEDGLPTDETELLDNETKALDAGITSTKDSIERVYGVDEAAAEKKLEEIKKENELMMPKMDPMADPFKKANTPPVK